MIHICSGDPSLDLLAGKIVLVVEPQAPIALLERSMALELGALEVRVCARACDGLVALEAGVSPDLAIVDLADEETAATLIARLDAAGVALVITSVADPRAQAADPAHIQITKPYPEAELVMAIAAAMGRRRRGA